MDRCAEKGWELLENGILIRKAEEEGLEVMVTADQCTRRRQDRAGGDLGLVVLMFAA